MMRAFRRIQSKDPELSQVQQAAADSFASLQQLPILDGCLLRNLTLTHGQDNVIAHTLGRPLQSVMLCLPGSQATVWADQTNNREPSKYVYVQCSADCVASVYVF